jgi:LysM repeat protein
VSVVATRHLIDKQSPLPQEISMSTTTAAVRPSSSLRLTRRGRIVVFALAMLVVLGAFVLFSSGSVATETPEATEVVTVGAGDTLWDIAAEHADDGEVLEMVAHIKDLNDLDSGGLMAGQKIRVPA